MANGQPANLGLEEAKERGKYFWQIAQEQLDNGSSFTEVAKSLGSTFNEIWEHFRLKQRRHGPNKLYVWLDRESSADAYKRLTRYWPKVVSEYRKDPKMRPDMLAVKYGVKTFVIARRLKKEGILKESRYAISLLLQGTDLNDVIDTLLEDIEENY